MVKIILNNQDRESPYKKAILDIASGTCLINNDETIHSSLLKKINFTHTLLMEPAIPATDGSYCYAYHDAEGLFNTARTIYATLIQINNPTDCRFKIAPSEYFPRLKAIYKIPFSLDYRKPAKELITVNQLNRIISRASGSNFQFQDNLEINETLSFNDLPPVVDGDALYKTNPQIHQLIKQADDFKKYELRYINHFVGFGVYSRKNIKKGEPVCLYYGIKNFSKTSKKRYSFHPTVDSLNLYTDAYPCGNIARFINHAPKPDNTKNTQPPSPLYEANLDSVIFCLHGIEVIAYFASRDIFKGEQLLVDYGSEYFENLELLRFKDDGNVIDSKNRQLHERKHQRMPILRIMAQNGIKQALWPLFKRPIAVLFVVLLTYLILICSPFSQLI